MRNFEEDWELINKVNNSLHVNAVNDEYDPDYQLDVFSNNTVNESDLTFVEQGKEMLIYYMNRVKELESNVAPDKPDPSCRPSGTIETEGFRRNLREDK